MGFENTKWQVVLFSIKFSNRLKTYAHIVQEKYFRNREVDSVFEARLKPLRDWDMLNWLIA